MGFTYKSRFPVEAWAELVPSDDRFEDGRHVLRGPDDWRARDAWPVVHRPRDAQWHARRAPRSRHHGLWRHGRLEAAALLLSGSRRRCLPDRPRHGRESCGGSITAGSTSREPMNCEALLTSLADRHPAAADPTPRIGDASRDGARAGIAGNATRPPDGRDRLHRGTAGARPRSRGGPASLSGAATGRARVARVADDGSGRRGSPRSGVARSRPRGHRRGLLPRALHGGTRRLPRNRIASPPAILAKRRGGLGFGGSCTSAASQRATRRSASISRAGSRPGRCCEKAESPSWNFARRSSIGSGQPVVRADPRARRAIAGHDLPAVGLDTGAADRHR